MSHEPCPGGGYAGCCGVREQCAGGAAFAFEEILRYYPLIY